jgi:hypothetical protein
MGFVSAREWHFGHDDAMGVAGASFPMKGTAVIWDFV